MRIAASWHELAGPEAHGAGWLLPMSVRFLIYPWEGDPPLQAILINATVVNLIL